MKFQFDSNLFIELNPNLLASNKLKEDTPGYAFLKRRYRSDLTKNMAALLAMLDVLKETRNDLIVDVMSGCGFSAKLNEKYLKPTTMILNDLDKGCAETLKHNFPSREVRQQNALEFNWGDLKPDLTFIDFNVLTLKTYHKWIPLLTESFTRSKRVLMIDSAVFGFKFGNMKSYGIEKEDEYFTLLGNEFYGKFRVYLTEYVIFSSSALVLFEKSKREMRRLYPKEITISIVEKGFLT